MIFLPSAAQAERTLGLDLSAWQGNLSQRTWNRLYSVDNREFVFLRSSRGGTTGFYNQSDPNNNGGQNTLSQRYDDPYFVQNITRATQAGLLAGSYHFSRPDIASNTGVDEADHFIEMAGAWMRPGYLLPVHDLEAGDGTRSDNELAQFTLDFSDRIHEVMGIRPAIYLNGNYASFVLAQASTRLRNEVVEKHPVLWSARPSNPSEAQAQVGHPKDTFTQIYGPWDDPPLPTHPWSFWQYSWTGDLSSYNGNLDLNVAQGGIEFVKDRLVPAVWMNANDGDWSSLANWNSGQTPIAPVQGPGQVPRVGSLTLPDVRLPAADDTVVLNRDDGDIIVTLSSGDHEIRKLVTYEELHLVGGSLTVNYVPHADSTTYSAHFAAPVTLNGTALSVHTVQVDPSTTFAIAGELTAESVELMPHASSPASLELIGDVHFNPLATAGAKITGGAGTGGTGFVDLGGESRTWTIADSAAAVDLEIDLPITNGGLAKSGLGALSLSGANTYAGDTTVDEGTLSLASAFLDDAADVYVGTNAILDLNFIGLDTVDALFLDGVSQAVGTWGAIGSGAQFTSPLITGAGLLQVSTIEAPLPGDFDGNGIVDSADMLQWEGDFGTNGGSDADDDGDSDGADFLLWQANYDPSANALSASLSIPEPTGFAILVGAAVVATAGRRWAGRSPTSR
ncbi:MAG: GH25 family lysozyme [Planctomycetota bacterium]